ncbi:aminoacyl-histidine dipeptidase [Bacillus sp. DX1.1]|uniref:aminoacyl-histidine dipeptidase n=1 Tax=unclassified Bacillus (in: firmicutes) TaxID=185979 RepID=UPI0025700BEF|nr:MULTISPECIES: aminoacyl-histidine dipeptidase [unclassified Bacillus (in: firmicutes)]MDM5154972.1 aminoacyl-histidine dipeptidase [Bacillus sp. DX1.1]WJE83836.1 aminoacyl-histidine dipeptidase [Bacillus sp. DX3.1]
MYTNLEQLTKHPVFHHFAEISKIPRGSGNEQEISDYLVKFAQERNLEVVQDKALNVIIKKPATAGYENVPAIIIQGHMDMVCEKNQATVHDFEKDPIQLRIVGDMLYANQTTLGADNGIAVGYALALLDAKDIPHPALEVVITTEEETTMGGAFAVDPKHFDGKIFINIDSEEDHKLLVSSAGGAKAVETIPVVWEEVPADTAAYRLYVGGLKGGHSGMEIDKERGNANKVLGRVLHDLSNEISFDISEIHGGLKTNAIPRESIATILLSAGDVQKVEEKVEEWTRILQEELRAVDPDVHVSLTKLEEIVETVFAKETQKQLISSLFLIPNGIQSMSMDIKGLVVSSTNLGVVETLHNEIKLRNEVRSSVSSLKQHIVDEIKHIAELVGAQFEKESEYPEWPYNPNSPIRDLFEKVHKEKYNKDAEIFAVHAGIECGVFVQKMHGLDAISLGPDIFNVHTPDEHISISSVINNWEYFIEVMRETKSLV